MSLCYADLEITPRVHHNLLNTKIFTIFQFVSDFEDLCILPLYMCACVFWFVIVGETKVIYLHKSFLLAENIKGVASNTHCNHYIPPHFDEFPKLPLNFIFNGKRRCTLSISSAMSLSLLLSFLFFWNMINSHLGVSIQTQSPSHPTEPSR